MLNGLPIPLSVCSDSYKAGHFLQYPPGTKKMVAYAEFRKPFHGLEDDHRLVFYGIRYIVKNFLEKRWTLQDVEQAALFYSTHNAGFTPYPFPKDLFLKFVRENDGYFPITLEALPEGSIVYPHVPVYQITAEAEYATLCTFLETLLTMVWYPSTVATLSRRCRQIVDDAFERTADPENFWKIESRLHDFGFRGCTSTEQSVIGGVAHLLNFRGSDTMSACYYAQFELNHGKPIAQSIPATEHSVMTSWRTETEAINNMINHFGSGVFACVMDSYDYANALAHVIPTIASAKVSKGGFMVVRPDSGDPVEAVLNGLLAEEKIFGVDINKKGFKVVRGASVIQGDGVGIHVIEQILLAVEKAGFSAENVAFGMGGGLLQKVNRDTMYFATKLNYICYADGSDREVMKFPKEDDAKFSLPGILKVVRNAQGIPIVDCYGGPDPNNVLKVVYDKKPLPGMWDESFETTRERVDTEWRKLPPKVDIISAALKSKIERSIAAQKMC